VWVPTKFRFVLGLLKVSVMQQQFFSWFLAHQKYCTQCQLCICRSDLTTLLPVLLQEQPVVVLLLKRDLFSWFLAIDERGGYEDLCGSDRQSVIPYVYGRIELYFSSLALPV
jgi:hypothetical protein